jgi:hypothetical protein
VYRVPVRHHRVRIYSIYASWSVLANQFDLCRMKCLLFALIRMFEFGLVLPVEDIVWVNQTMVRRPVVRGAERDGQKLPLYVKVHIPDA